MKRLLQKDMSLFDHNAVWTYQELPTHEIHC